MVLLPKVLVNQLTSVSVFPTNQKHKFEKLLLHMREKANSNFLGENHLRSFENGMLSTFAHLSAVSPSWRRSTLNCNSTICLLKRSLYGLKQSGRQWFTKLDEKLKQMNFNSLNSDKCVYISKSPIEAIIVVYVDDLIILTKNQHDYEYIRDELSN